MAPDYRAYLTPTSPPSEVGRGRLKTVLPSKDLIADVSPERYAWMLLSLAAMTDRDETPREFAALAKQWRAETGHLSLVRQIAMHRAYQRIIGLGARAVPLILEDLRTHGGQWYWALWAITNQSPVPANQAGNIAAMKAAWLRWGASNGYIDNRDDAS